MSLNAVYAFGRCINSPFALPGLALTNCQADAAIVGEAIEVVEAATTLESVFRTFGPYLLGKNGLKISVSGNLSFLCDLRGRQIKVQADSTLSADFVSSYLIANGIPAALWLQGERLLHAGAARLAGCESAVLLAGDSGSGKSTVLAELVQRGAALIAEDVCTLRVGRKGITVAGFAGEIQLRHVEGSDDRVPMPVPDMQQRSMCLARTVVVLNQNDGTREPHPQRLHGIQALQALLRQRYRPMLAGLLEREAGDLQTWVESSKLLSVYSWNPRLIQRDRWARILSDLCSSADQAGGLA